MTFASLAFLAVWVLFSRQRVPFAWLWALALLGISDAFLYRMSVARAQSLSLAVLALACTWLLEGKYKHLAVLSFVYVWMYDAFPLILALGLIHLVSVALSEHRLEARPLLFIFGGVLAGLILNPYFPNNLIFSYKHMLPKLTGATFLSVGNEWYPYDTGQLLKNSLPAFVAFAGGALALGLSGRKMDLRTALGFFSALLFGLMLFTARRFVEYFPPFALIFCAFAFSPLIKGISPARVEPDRTALRQFASRLQPHLPILILAIVTFSGMVRSIPNARAAIKDSAPYDLYAGASAWLAQNTPPGSHVFQTDWDDFPRLFFYNTHNTYLIGLDPTFMQLYNPGLYDLWVDITQGRIEQPSRYIFATFESTYVHTDLNHTSFLRVAEGDPGLLPVYRDDQAAIFQVLVPK